MKRSIKELSGGFDVLKWALVVGLLVAVVLGNHCYRGSALAVRVVAAGVAIFLALLVARMTQQGKKTANFVQEAYCEIHRVDWPTRQEVLKTTMVVAAVTVVIALALWGIDTILVRLVTFITGVRF